MSKSLGNILTIKEVLKEWHPEVLRLFFLSSHYRSPLDYSEESLKEAKSGLDRFYATLKAVEDELKNLRNLTPSPHLPQRGKVRVGVPLLSERPPSHRILPGPIRRSHG